MKILALLILLPIASIADTVVPIDAVENNVNVRLSPDANSEIVGKLDQGSAAQWVASIDGWHEIQIEGGATGFISADWSRVVSAEVVVEDTQELVEAVAEATPVVEAEVEPTAEPEVVAAPVPPAETVPAAEAEPMAEAEPPVETEPVTEFEPVVEADADDASVETAMDDDVAIPRVVPRADFEGSKNFVVKFRDVSEGGNSQIYDNGNRIGIGTTDPKQRLEVNGSIQIHEQHSSVAGLMITQSSGDTGYIMHNRASTLTIGAGSQDRITIDRDGNVGFAVSRPDHPLEMQSGAHVTAGGVWTNSSSRSLKENIESLTAGEAASALMQLDPVTFNYKIERDEGYVGFIAEDVPALLGNTRGDAISSMDIVAVLTRVVQEQQQRIEALERRLDEKL